MKIESKEKQLGNTYANLTFVLVDILESSLMNTNELLRKQGCELRHESKRNFNTAIASVRKLKDHVNKCNDKTQIDFGNDSDMLYNMLLLLVDRCGDDDMKLFKFFNYIKSFPSQMGLEIDNSVFGHVLIPDKVQSEAK